ncbi:MAG: glycosyltransferase, partial [Alphaproteobacteria bacterium]|nr:glycosyltransferase [Alphaproteobacteria bacterium]
MRIPQQYPRLATATQPQLTVVVPIYNEAESIPLFLESLIDQLEIIDRDYEVIAVDDGSRDRSQELLSEAATHYRRLKVIQFRQNAGQTAALMAGIDHASGDVIVTIDGD